MFTLGASDVGDGRRGFTGREARFHRRRHNRLLDRFDRERERGGETNMARVTGVLFPFFVLIFFFRLFIMFFLFSLTF